MTSQNKNNITIDTSNIADGQTIDAADITVPFDEVKAHLQDGWLRVSENDTNIKHLEDAIVGTNGLVVCAVDDGTDETFKIEIDQNVVATTENTMTLLNKTYVEPDIANFFNAQHDHSSATRGGRLTSSAFDTTGVTSNYVLTADGAGSAVWQEVQSDATQSIDLTVTAGQNLAERDMVYLDESTGTWFKIDTNDIANLRVGSLRGCVNESGGILSGADGTVRVFGEVSGFSGLTPWLKIYASVIPGSYTTVKPAVANGGGQVAVCELGYAASSSVIFMDQKPIFYAKRETLLNNESMTIQHHSDSSTSTRDLNSYIATTVEGSAVTEYGIANQNDAKGLKNGSDASVLFNDITGLTLNVGRWSTIYHVYRAQSFIPATSGYVSNVAIFIEEFGSAGFNVFYSIRNDDNNAPDTSASIGGAYKYVATGKFDMPFSNPVYVEAGKKYWVYLVVNDTADNTGIRYFTLTANSTSSAYVDTPSWFTNNDNGTTAIRNSENIKIEITFDAVADIDKLAQSFEIPTASFIGSVKLYLKKINDPQGQLSLSIQTDDGSIQPSGTAIGTSTIYESSLTNDFQLVRFDFDPYISLDANTRYWLVLNSTRTENGTDYIEWGIDNNAGYGEEGQNNELQTNDGTTWSEAVADAIFSVHETDTLYNDPCVIGRWTGTTSRDIAVRFDDGNGNNSQTNTTFKNVSGSSLDVICKVEVS